ncbi:hypothetical protein [Duncaniella muris]
MWRQVLDNSRQENARTDWNLYKKEYARFLPHINNGYDFCNSSQ